MPILTYKQLSEAPEVLRELATTADDGTVTINVVAKSELDTFRQNNIDVSKEKDAIAELAQKYAAITGVPIADVAEKLEEFGTDLTSLRDVAARVKDGKLVEDTSLEAAAAERVNDVKKALGLQLQDAAKERDAQTDRAKRAENAHDHLLVENALQLVAMDPEVGMHDSAVKHVLADAAKTFKVIDGKLSPKAPEGTTIYGSDGVTPITMKEWLTKQRDVAPYLFKGSNGGGASGGTGGGGGSLTQEQFEKLTPEQKMMRGRELDAKHGN